MISPFQKDVAELLIDLSLFVNKLNPNPLVAIAAIEILEHKIIEQYIFDVEISDPKIPSEEVKILYDQLLTFFKELDLFPDAAISALEITKNEFIKEIGRIGKMRKK